MLRYVVAYAAVLVAFLAIDLVWLGVIARDFYKAHLAAMMAPRPLLVPAALFYLSFALGLVIFAVVPGLRDSSWRTALASGLMFGFFAYGTYDLTNLATLRDWSQTLSIVDLAWGTALSGVAAAIGYFAAAALPAA